MALGLLRLAAGRPAACDALDGILARFRPAWSLHHHLLLFCLACPATRPNCSATLGLLLRTAPASAEQLTKMCLADMLRLMHLLCTSQNIKRWQDEGVVMESNRWRRTKPVGCVRTGVGSQLSQRNAQGANGNS